MSSEQNQAIVGRLFQKMSADNVATLDELLAAEGAMPGAAIANNGVAHDRSHDGRGRGNAAASQEARLARIAAHVAEEAALLRGRS